MSVNRAIERCTRVFAYKNYWQNVNYVAEHSVFVSDEAVDTHSSLCTSIFNALKSLVTNVSVGELPEAQEGEMSRSLAHRDAWISAKTLSSFSRFVHATAV